jgi:hypothetical protein
MRKPVIRRCETCGIKFLSYRKVAKFCTRRCSGIKSMDNKPRITFIEKFCLVLNVSEVINKCWNWPKGKDRKGYGQFHHGRNGIYKAHRVSYQIFKGDIPERLCVCHSCDNAGCVNPDHLWIGTIKDNNLDRVRKGRDRPRGKAKIRKLK